MGIAYVFTPTFALPSSVQVLSQSLYPFTAEEDYVQLVIPWALSLTLIPNYNDDDDCKQEGGQAPPTDVPEELRGDPFEIFPVSSSIGCQNQSLGEDVPIVGTGFYLHYESDRAAGAPSDSIATADAAMLGDWTLSVHHAWR